MSAVEIEALPASPGPAASWGGCDMLVGGKGYVAAPLGQLHYRDIGPKGEGPVLLLLHQSPMSMVEFGEVQNSLARLGVRSVAPDTPGYGMSDQPTILPTIGGFADNLIALLDHLELEKVVVAGHHTGACIATAVAARHPERVAGIILHGAPLYTPEEAEKHRASVEWDRSPKIDGSHIAQLFLRRKSDDMSPEDQLVRTWVSICMFLQGRDFGHWAVNRYDMAADLRALTAPGLIITEVGDTIHHMDHRALEMRPEFQYRVLTEVGYFGIMTEPDRWAQFAVEFIRDARL